MFLNKKSLKIVIISLFFISVLLLPFFVFSQDFGMSETAAKSGYDTTPDNIYVTIGNVINTFFATIAFIFFGLTLYAGLRWLTARGKEEFIERAKATMEGAIIGLIITVLSYGIANFTISRLSSGGVPMDENVSGCCMGKSGSNSGFSCQNDVTYKDCKDLGENGSDFMQFEANKKCAEVKSCVDINDTN